MRLPNFSKCGTEQGGQSPEGGEVPGRLLHTLWGGEHVQRVALLDQPCQLQRGAPVLCSAKPDQLRGGDEIDQSTAAVSALSSGRQVSANGDQGESVQGEKPVLFS